MEAKINHPNAETVRVDKIEPGEYFTHPVLYGNTGIVYRRLASLKNIAPKGGPRWVYTYAISGGAQDGTVVHFAPEQRVWRLRQVRPVEFEVIETE